jgi:hypothetical protein
MLKFIPAILTVLLLGAVYAESLGKPKAEDANVFHSVVRRAVGAQPETFGAYRSTEVPIPPAAQQLLRQNSAISRRFVNEESGRAGSLLMVQCSDSRDMTGHYPPVCYPANGWEPVKVGGQNGSVVTVRIGDRPIEVMKYVYARTIGNEYRSIVVYNFFVIPSKGIILDMPAVRRAAATFGLRFFGAAQVQAVVDGAVDQSEQIAIVEDLWNPMI